MGFFDRFRKRVKEVAEESKVTEMVDVASNDDPLAMAFVTALDGFGSDSESGLIDDAVSADPMQAAFASSILESKQAPADSGPPSAPPSAPTGPPTGSSTGPPGPPPK